jgi:membrane protein DedA with SNARE-associated domain
MVIAGVLMQKGSLPIHSTVIAAFLGALSGITVSYFLGRTAGHYLIVKYGKWIGLTQERYQKTHEWFEKFGKWTLSFGYFIPCVRHLTGVAAGASDLGYRVFALYAYCGAAIWVATFLSLGYFFGRQGLALYAKLEIGSQVILLGAAILVFFVLFFFYRKFKKKP